MAGFTLALAVFDRSESGFADREWLIERYCNMYSMLHDLLHVDPMYQAIIQEGRQEERQGRIRDLQQTALKIIKANFPQARTSYRA